MNKFIKVFISVFCLLVVFNLCVYAKDKPITKEETNTFVGKFVDAVSSSNDTEIKKCLALGEAKIIEMFKIYSNNANNIIRAYYYMAKGNSKIGNLEIAEELYDEATKLILDEQDNQNHHLNYLVFKDKAICMFEIARNLDNRSDKKIKLQEANEYIIKAKDFGNDDFETFYYAGKISFAMFDAKSAVEYLTKAKSLTQEVEIQNKIQQEIDDINKQVEEATLFINNASNCFKGNKDEINNFLKTDEEKIIELVKLYNDNDEFIMKSPEAFVCFIIAINNEIIEDYELAYEYYTKAISILDNIDINNEDKCILFYRRALVLKTIVEKSEKGLYDENVENLKKVNEDLQEAMKLNPKNHNVFWCSGNINFYYLGNYKLGVQHLNQALDLCNDNEEKKEIQKNINEINKEINKANNFVDNFKRIIKVSNKSKKDNTITINKIKEYLNEENKILTMFDICDNDIEIVKNPEACSYFYMAEGYFEINLLETAYEYYTKAISFSKDDDKLKGKILKKRAWTIFNTRNSSDLEDKNIQKAFEDIEEALSLNSKDYDALVYRAWMYFYMEDIKMAKDELNKAKSLCENETDKNIVKKEIDDLRKEIDKANKFIDNFKKAIDNSSKNTIEKCLEKGEQEIVKMFEMSDKHDDVNKNPKIFAYFFIANAYYKIKKYDNAVKYYTKSISLFDEAENIDDKTKATIFASRASSLFILRNSDDLKDLKVQEALKDMEEAIEFDSKNYEIYLDRGKIYYIAGEENMATEDFNKAKSLCKNENEKKEIQKQINELKKYKQIEEANDFVCGFIESINSSDKYASDKFLDKSENEIVKMFEISNYYSDVSKHPKTFAYIFIAKAYNKVGSYYYACQYYTKAISLNSNIDYSTKASIYRDRAVCILKEAEESNNSEKAQRAYNDIMKSISLYSNDWYAYFIAGKINTIFGNRDKALEQLYKSKSLCNDYNTKNDIQKCWIAKLESDKDWDELCEMGKYFLKGAEIGATILSWFL